MISRHLPIFTTLFTMLFPLSVHFARAHEISGYLEAEGRLFTSSPLYETQRHHNASLALQPEYYHQWDNGNAVTITPFLRQDSNDNERRHVDIREANILYVGNTYEARVGIGKFFWGTTEFIHLVDIINQTDLIEEIDGEDKLGQPMAKLSLPETWGTIDLFLLPWFRERTFPGQKGRLRTQPAIDVDHPQYESAAEDHHLDIAARYSHTLGDMDFGISYFQGTGREPMLVPNFSQNSLTLTPYYPLINQSSLDMQWAAGNWLWKLEALYRHGQGRAYNAATGGFEYTFYGIGETNADIGFLVEYARDDRGMNATSFAQNDIMAGIRLALNDMPSSELLAGVITDLDGSGSLCSLEASRRLGEFWKIFITARFFNTIAADDVLYQLRQDDYVRLQIRYYF